MPETYLALATLAVLACVFIGFVLETHPPATIAIGGVATLFAIGALTPDLMLGALSSAAPAAILLLFILSAALARTGVIDSLGRAVRRLAAHHRGLALALALLGPMAMSAFINNTAVVLVLMPVAISLANALGAPASRLLMPLSFACVLGGLTTLVGTSTNLLIDGVARDLGQPAFGLFEMSAVGAPVAAVGALYLAFIAPRLLPARPLLSESGAARSGSRFVIEAIIPVDSPLAGAALAESTLFDENSVRVIDVLRGDESLRRDLRAVTLAAGDRIVMRSDLADLEQLRADGLLSLTADQLAPVQSRRSALMEALVGPGALVIGRDLHRLRLRRRYGVYPIAAHRRGVNLAARFETTPLEVGDTVLLEGAPEDLRRLNDDFQLIALSEPPERSLRPERAPMALGALGFVVLGAAFGFGSIVSLAVIAVGALLLTKTIDLDEALDSVDGGLLLLVYAMLTIGAALQATGATMLLVGVLEPFLAMAPILLVLALVYLATALLTELVTNNAVAVLMAPIAIELASALELGDPRPLLILVMIAASASFATPIGYQTNTLVYAAGAYRFADFLRAGAPLSLLCASVAVTMVWVLYF